MSSMSRWRAAALAAGLAAAVACLVGGAAMAWAGVGRQSVDGVVAGVLYLLAGGEFWWALGGAVRGCLGGCDE